MTISRSQMYRQLYQMGGQGIMQLGNGQEEPIFPRLEALNQNLGQAEQTLGQPSDQFNISSITTAITGRPQMNVGGRMGYQEGDMAMMQPEAGGMMQDQMMQQPQIDPSQMDPKQALEIIIQMLIAQGIPPEQAKEIAIQMVQAVAEGGMEEMGEERIEARFGGRIGYAYGGIGNLVNRQGYFLGDIAKGITGAVKGVVKGVTGAVKSVVKSDLGKAALTIAALYASGGGFSPGGFSFFGNAAGGAGLLGSGGAFNLGSSYLGQGLFGAPTMFAPGTSEIASFGSKGLLGNLGITGGFGADLFSGGISSLLPSTNTLKTFGLGTLFGKAFGGGAPKREDYGSDEEFEQAVAQWKSTLQSRLDQPKPQFAAGQYPNNPFYPGRQMTAMAANGGRIGYQEGGIGNLIKQVTQQEFFGTPMMANGGRMNYGFGGMLGRISKMVKDVVKKEPSDSLSVTPEKLNELITQKNTISFRPVNPLYDYTLEDLINLRRENQGYTYAANGGRMGYALGAEVPTRQNQAGVTELDYRDTGGFVPPIGIKERADDIPAMLSNNEFVFTADAVRNAGEGNVNKGAERMYTLMKSLEAGGRV